MKINIKKYFNKNAIISDVFFIYLVFIFIGFIGTLIYYILTKHFTYLDGWLFPVPFVMVGLYLQQKNPDWLLKKAKEYGEHATKPKGFMLLSSTLYISSYIAYVVPFIIIWAISVSHNVSLLNEDGWFNIYCALGSTFLLLILLFMVKLISNYYINKKS